MYEMRDSSTQALINQCYIVLRSCVDYKSVTAHPYIAYQRTFSEDNLMRNARCELRLSSTCRNLPTLHYRRLRWDMIMDFKIVTSVMDSMVSCRFIGSHSVTRGNRYKLTQKHVDCNLTKFSFANTVVSILNSLPDYLVSACSVKFFETRLDYFWRDQECLHEWKASLSGIGIGIGTGIATGIGIGSRIFV